MFLLIAPHRHAYCCVYIVCRYVNRQCNICATWSPNQWLLVARWSTSVLKARNSPSTSGVGASVDLAGRTQKSGNFLKWAKKRCKHHHTSPSAHVPSDGVDKRGDHPGLFTFWDTVSRLVWRCHQHLHCYMHMWGVSMIHLSQHIGHGS